MKLTYFSGQEPNFGDELNDFLWDEILPVGFLDEDPAQLFLGIGSILWNDYPIAARKVVAGSGYGGYTPPPNVQDGSWDVIFVRGPKTAARLGLAPEKAICDSALLLRLLPAVKSKTSRSKVAFMPHFQSLMLGFWPKVCERAGISMIDPRSNPHEIIDRIKAVDVLVTEAMHGAIVADALRTPWICARPVQAAHQSKWLDWAESLEINLRSHPLSPSNLREWYQSRSKAPKVWRGKILSEMPIFTPINEIMTDRAAQRLVKLTGCEPQLSADDVIDSVTIRASEALEKFVRSEGFRGLKV